MMKHWLNTACMRTLFALFIGMILTIPMLEAQELPSDDEAIFVPAYPELFKTYGMTHVGVFEWTNDEGAPLEFQVRNVEEFPRDVAGSIAAPYVLMMYTGRDENDEYLLDSLATVPGCYGSLTPKFACDECMEGNWSWALDMVDSLGITRAGISRDCNQRLHAVVNDLQINMPERAQAVTKQLEPVGTVE